MVIRARVAVMTLNELQVDRHDAGDEEARDMSRMTMK